MLYLKRKVALEYIYKEDKIVKNLFSSKDSETFWLSFLFILNEKKNAEIFFL